MNKFADKLKQSIFGKSIGAYVSLGCGCLLIVSVIYYLIYSLVFDYFDALVLFELLLAVCCAVVYCLFAEKSRAAGFMNMVSAILVSCAMIMFFYNSYGVWADVLNGITMYGSRGGLTTVIIQLALMLIAEIGLIVSCFMKEQPKVKEA